MVSIDMHKISQNSIKVNFFLFFKKHYNYTDALLDSIFKCIVVVKPQFSVYLSKYVNMVSIDMQIISQNSKVIFF